MSESPSEERAIREIATALRAAIDDDPHRAQTVARLFRVLDAVLA